MLYQFHRFVSCVLSVETNQVVANVTDFLIFQKGCDNMKGMKGIYSFNPALVGGIIGLIIDLFLCKILP